MEPKVNLQILEIFGLSTICCMQWKFVTRSDDIEEFWSF